MQGALVTSFALHVAIMLLAYFGLPASPPADTPMADAALSVELVDVAETSNLPPAVSPRPELVPEDAPKPQARAPEPAKRERPPPPPPPPAAAKAEPEPPAPKVEPTPPAEPVASASAPSEPAPAVEASPAPAFAPKRKAKAPPRPAPAVAAQVAEAEPKKEAKKEKKAPEPAKPQEEPAKLKAEPAQPKEAEKPKPDAEMDFAAVLKSLDTGTQGAAPGRTERGEAAGGSSAAETSGRNASAGYDPSLPVTSSEIDAVRRQIERCWNLPAGARDASDLKVTIVVDMNVDGTPRRAEIEDEALMQGDAFHRVAAESALRAVLNPRCQPFKLPRDKYERWRTMTIVFDPKDMFGT